VIGFLAVSQDALCDDEEEVREAAAKAFGQLQHTVGGRAVDEILPSLLAELTSGNAARANRATHGLRGILSQRSKDVRAV
jgi:HEAT repeat